MPAASQLITRTREIIGITDTSSSLITDTEILAWLNISHRDLCARLEWDKSEWTGLPVTGQRTYTLPSDMMLLEALYWNINGSVITELEVIPMDHLKNRFGTGWRSDADGVPQVGYWADALVLGVHPFPNAANVGTEYIRLLGVPYPTALASTDTPVVPTIYHDVMPYLAASIAWTKLRNIAESEKTEQTYDKMFLKSRYPATRKANSLRQIRWGISTY